MNVNIVIELFEKFRIQYATIFIALFRIVVKILSSKFKQARRLSSVFFFKIVNRMRVTLHCSF